MFSIDAAEKWLGGKHFLAEEKVAGSNPVFRSLFRGCCPIYQSCNMGLVFCFQQSLDDMSWPAISRFHGILIQMFFDDEEKT